MCIDTSAEPNPSFLSARQCESNKRKIRKCSWCGWVQSHWHPKQVRSKGRKANTVRREVAACLLYCGHEHDPPFCSVWHCHRVSGCCRWGNSSISLTFMGLSGGGCPFRLLLLRESPYLPAMGASCSQVIYLHSETDVIQREERVLPSLCRWRHNWRPRLHFDKWLCCCRVLYSYFPPVGLLGALLIVGFSYSSQQLLHAVLNACLWFNCKKSAFRLWIKLEAFLSGSFY